MSEPDGAYPRLFPQADQTIAGIGRALREGRATCADLLRRCLEQVEEWEPKVHAWVVLDRAGAIEQARALDLERKAGRDRGPLHGIPLGIKDIIDVKGLPTACGAKRWAERVPENDALIVARLRAAGALILGKTVTTPYAWIDPPVTRNPWNLERTPGGSSSGSAAAVACGMCFGAIGTQTGGSITRPASFCGVAGMKPSKLLQVDLKLGVRPFASSLDHVGPIARTVGDLRLLLEAICEPSFQRSGSEGNPSRAGPVKLGRLRGFFDRRATRPVLSVLDEAVSTLQAAGADIAECVDPVDFDGILADHRTVMAAEAAREHSDELDEFPDDYPPRIRDLIREGRSPSALEYLRALDRLTSAGVTLMEPAQHQGRRFWITPATVGTAPDPSTTGDPRFNSPWSATGLPTVSFPIGLAADGLPVAIQMIGEEIFSDLALLRAAEWCENVIRTRGQ